MKDIKSLLLLILINSTLSILALFGLCQAAERLSTLGALERIPVHKSDTDENPLKRIARLRLVADAIDAATSKRGERAALVALGRYESHFARDVCEGVRLGDRGKAYGCWQSHDKDRSGGVEAQAQRAIRDLRRGGNYCRARGHDYWTGAFSIYATGRQCSWSEAETRVRFMRNIEWRMK